MHEKVYEHILLQTDLKISATFPNEKQNTLYFFYFKAICQFQGRTYFEGERSTVYSSGVCVLYECKVSKLLHGYFMDISWVFSDFSNTVNISLKRNVSYDL